MTETKTISQADRSFLASAEKAIFSDFWSEDALKSFLANPYARGFILKEEGEAVGYVLGTALAGEGELMRIGILPQNRRRGYGATLVSALIELWKTEGIERAFLEVRESNLPARRLYESMGFSPAGFRPNYYDHPREDAVIYQKNLERNDNL